MALHRSCEHLPKYQAGVWLVRGVVWSGDPVLCSARAARGLLDEQCGCCRAALQPAPARAGALLRGHLCAQSGWECLLGRVELLRALCGGARGAAGDSLAQCPIPVTFFPVVYLQGSLRPGGRFLCPGLLRWGQLLM